MTPFDDVRSRRHSARTRISLVLLAFGVLFLPCAAALEATEAGQRLLAAYPDHVARVEDGAIVWKDGTRMMIDDGQSEKSFEALLTDPDLEDIFAVPYPAGPLNGPPAPNADPGRARPSAFFDKMYGDCRRGEVERHLTEIVWLPGKRGTRVKFTRVNGADQRLAAVSAELDRLPPEFDVYLLPPGGTYNCRAIAGTDRTSAHGAGIAIDIALARADYWRWSKPGADGADTWRNRVPEEIVRIFERHGFIWGGKWHHFDTMHFEFRPELMPPAAALPSP